MGRMILAVPFFMTKDSDPSALHSKVTSFGAPHISVTITRTAFNQSARDAEAARAS